MISNQLYYFNLNSYALTPHQNTQDQRKLAQYLDENS